MTLLMFIRNKKQKAIWGRIRSGSKSSEMGDQERTRNEKNPEEGKRGIRRGGKKKEKRGMAIPSLFSRCFV